MSNVDADAWLALGQPSRPQRTQISVDGKPSVSGHSRRERRYACSSWYCPALNVVLAPSSSSSRWRWTRASVASNCDPRQARSVAATCSGDSGSGSCVIGSPSGPAQNTRPSRCSEYSPS